MAIILYKKGNTAKVRGIPCQFQICNEFSYLHLLEQGWFYTPEECYAEEEEPELVETPEVFKSDLEVAEETPETEEESTETDGEASIRLAAKVAGISHWHNKNISRLTRELEELDNGEQSED